MENSKLVNFKLVNFPVVSSLFHSLFLSICKACRAIQTVFTEEQKRNTLHENFSLNIKLLDHIFGPHYLTMTFYAITETRCSVMASVENILVSKDALSQYNSKRNLLIFKSHRNRWINTNLDLCDFLCKGNVIKEVSNLVLEIENWEKRQ